MHAVKIRTSERSHILWSVIWLYVVIHHENRPIYFDPLKPHFYIVKLGFTGVYIIFLIFAQKHRLWVLVRTASPRRFWRVPTIYVLSKSIKNISFFIPDFFSIFGGIYFSIYLNRRVFVMCIVHVHTSFVSKQQNVLIILHSIAG